MTESDEITRLIEKSRNSFSHEDDSKTRMNQKCDVLCDAFILQMTGACERYYDLIMELLRHPRRDGLAGTAGCFRLSWWHNVYLEISYPANYSISFVLYMRYPGGPFYLNGYASFACCVIEKRRDDTYGFSHPYKECCSEDTYKNMKYFVEHFTYEWLYKAVKKELRKRIEIKECVAWNWLSR